MAQGLIYMVEADGALRRMAPSAPDNEDRMQMLVARYPELITDGDGDLLLIKREQEVSDGPDGAARWSLDHLFVTRNAVPVLVELKRAVDTRLRREVVGQMLDYAANATAYWVSGRLADSFAATAAELGQDPEQRLAAFIDDRDPADFWGQVDANLRAGRVKLVFVADNIPNELARIVEFLNEQMRADVRAVELRWFAGDGAITLSPRVIGETARTAAKQQAKTLPPMPVDDWVATWLGEKPASTTAGAKTLIALGMELGYEVSVARTHGSVYLAAASTSRQWHYPLRIWKDGAVSLELRYLKDFEALAAPEARKALLDGLVGIVGNTSNANIDGAPTFPASRLDEPKTVEQMRYWLAALHRQITT